MEREYIELAIKTPIFHGDKRNPPALVGIADGWINPEEVCGITSGIHQVSIVADARNKKQQNQKPRPGGFMTVLHFHSGDRILVMGTPAELRKQLIEVLNAEEDVEPEEEQQEHTHNPELRYTNESPDESNEPPEEPNEPQQSDEEGGE